MGLMKRKNIYIESPFLTFLVLGIQFFNHFNFNFLLFLLFFFSFFFFCLYQVADQVLGTLLCLIFLLLYFLMVWTIVFYFCQLFVVFFLCLLFFCVFSPFLIVIVYFVYSIISMFFYWWLSYFSPQFLFTLLLFQIHKWSHDISNRHHRHFNTGLAFDCLVFSLSWVTLCDHP